MRKLLARIVLNMVAIWIAANFISGVSYPSIEGLFFAAIIFGLVNAVVKPILIVISFPLTIMTLGLFLLVINGITFEITTALTALSSRSFLASMQAGVIITISNWFLYSLFGKDLKK